MTAYGNEVADVLFVEDDEKIGRLLTSVLSGNGHTVTWQRTGNGALAEARETTYDVVLLDLGLPDIDGVDVCRALKQRQPEAIVIILTARRDEIDVVAGLESGADDYLVKPIRTTELLARLRAHLRRVQPRFPAKGPIVLGDLVVDSASRVCRLQDRVIPLRSKEFDLLQRLAETPGEAVSRSQLMSDVWDEHWTGPTKTLDVHIAALRARINEAAAHVDGTPELPRLTTLRGFGYRLEPPAEQSSPDVSAPGSASTPHHP